MESDDAKHTERRPFELRYPSDSSRVIRGRIELPAGIDDRSTLSHVVLVHGFKGFMDWGFFPTIAKRIARHGAVAVSFNMSGSGIGADLATFSDEDAFARDTYSRQLEDLDFVLRWARSGAVRGIDPQRTTLLGHSRGAAVALLHADRDPACRALIGWAPMSHVDRYDAATKAAWREQGFVFVHNARTGQDLRVGVDALEDIERNRGRHDVLAACRRLRARTLLVHGKEDETLDWRETAALAEAAPAGVCDTLFVPGSGHTFGVVHPPPAGPAGELTPEWERVAAATLDWIRRYG